jgi:hypothetical protein
MTPPRIAPSTPAPSVQAKPSSAPARWIAGMETAARVLPVLVLMLPVAGGIYRLIAFANGEPYVPQVVAGHLPITDLAVIGVTQVLLAPLLVILFLAMLYLYATRVIPQYLRMFIERPGRRLGRRRIVGLLVTSSLVSAAVLIVAGFPPELLAFSYAGSFLGFAVAWLVWRYQHELTITRLALLVVVITAGLSVWNGLRPNSAGTAVADIVSADEAALESGRYVVLGHVDELVWLLPCDNQTAAVQTRAATIARQTLIPPVPGSSAISVVDALNSTPGFVPQC